MKLPAIIGFPGSIENIDPDNGNLPERIMDTWKTQHDTFLIGQIIPGVPAMSTGQELYYLDEGEGIALLEEKLASYGIEMPDEITESGLAPDCLNIAFQNQSAFSESFGNDFGPSEIIGGAIQNALQASQGMMEAQFLTGSKKVSEMGGAVGEKFGGMFGAGIKGAGGIYESLTKKIGEQGTVGKLVEGIMQAKGKVDFPSIWKGSSFQAAYELNIRLYNPFPKNKKLQQYLITNPLIALLQFVSPSTEDGMFYQWPLIMRFKIPGLVNLKAAYCSQISVVKGGDINDVAWNQRAGTVDIRMSIGSLYSTCLNYDGEEDPESEIPDLKSYKGSLEEEKIVKPFSEETAPAESIEDPTAEDPSIEETPGISNYISNAAATLMPYTSTIYNAIS